MRPSEMQMGVPVPARAHACTVGCGVMWAWYMARKRVVRVCGCGYGVTVLGRGLCGGSTTARGPRLTRLRHCACQRGRRDSRSRRRSRSWSPSSCYRRHRRSRSFCRIRQKNRHSSSHSSSHSVQCSSYTCSCRCGQERRPRVTRLGKGEREDGRGGRADQLPSQLEATSCRRARAPSTPPVIADSCAEWDESCALSSGKSTQPWTAESIIARWTIIECCGPWL